MQTPPTFPEELNRKIAGDIATWHFAPTSEARDNLIAEGKDPAAIFVTGNTVIDTLLHFSEAMDHDALMRDERAAVGGPDLVVVRVLARHERRRGNRDAPQLLLRCSARVDRPGEDGKSGRIAERSVCCDERSAAVQLERLGGVQPDEEPARAARDPGGGEQ